jgi:hypothetical protein
MGHQAESRMESTMDRTWVSGVRRQMTEVEDRRQMTEDRGQKTDARKWTTKSRSAEVEFGIIAKDS